MSLIAYKWLVWPKEAFRVPSMDANKFKTVWSETANLLTVITLLLCLQNDKTDGIEY